MTSPSAENNDVVDLTYADDLISKNKFFKSMLQSMSVNIQEELNNSINILLDPNKHVGEYDHALDVIEEYIDNIDYAIDFQRLGGFQVFIPGLKSPELIVRSKTAQLIAGLVQNNLYCQEKFIEHPTYINLLMNVAENDVDVEVRIKAFFAISCLVRQNVSIFWKFIDVGGINLVVNALKSSNDKMQIKGMFLIYSTCHMGNDVAEIYVDNGVVELICLIVKSMEKSFENFHHDLFLSTLNQLLRMSPSKVKQICTSVKDFKVSLLSLRDSYPSNNMDYQEEKDQILWLMETLAL